MSDETKPVTQCNQFGCTLSAVFRFTWPGSDEAGICEAHVPKLRAICDAMGLYVQLIPIGAEREEQRE